jgi:hypothetical protein
MEGAVGYNPIRIVTYSPKDPRQDLMEPVSFDLDGQVALVTAASRGIGHESRAREGGARRRSQPLPPRERARRQ